jgi:hypothetical protein
VDHSVLRDSLENIAYQQTDTELTTKKPIYSDIDPIYIGLQNLLHSSVDYQYIVSGGPYSRFFLRCQFDACAEPKT